MKEWFLAALCGTLPIFRRRRIDVPVEVERRKMTTKQSQKRLAEAIDRLERAANCAKPNGGNGHG